MIGAEMSQHMCDVGAETVVMNGYADKCILVNKDVRRMDVAQKPDGTPPDMTNKADVLVFEVTPLLCLSHVFQGDCCYAPDSEKVTPVPRVKLSSFMLRDALQGLQGRAAGKAGQPRLEYDHLGRRARLHGHVQLLRAAQADAKCSQRLLLFFN